MDFLKKNGVIIIATMMGVVSAFAGMCLRVSFDYSNSFGSGFDFGIPVFVLWGILIAPFGGGLFSFALSKYMFTL